MQVAPSPLNVVKLELGIILVVGMLLFLVTGRLIAGLLPQMTILATYSIAGGLWIVVRTRRIVQEMACKEQVDGPHQK